MKDRNFLFLKKKAAKRLFESATGALAQPQPMAQIQKSFLVLFFKKEPFAGMTSQDTLLTVSELTMRFGGLTAVNAVGFEAKRGNITAVIGPNGAGKTTLFNCITGFYKPTAGSIAIAHTPGGSMLLNKLPGHSIARKGKVARTFQNIRMFGGMTVLENLLVAQHNELQAATGFGVLAILGLGRYRAAEKAAIERARHWLEATDLLARADDPAGSLPYGAQRRLEIARAMCTNPVLLCLDEPAAGPLNPRESHTLNELLLKIRDAGCSLLLIEHDMGVVMKISDHIIVLDHGKKIADGTPLEIRNDSAVIAAYLGEGDEDDPRPRPWRNPFTCTNRLYERCPHAIQYQHLLRSHSGAARCQHGGERRRDRHADRRQRRRVSPR